MMKKLIFLIGFIFLLACEKNEEKPNEIPVFKTITERNYSGKFVDEKSQIDGFLSKEVYYYDRNGNMIEQVSYDKSEILKRREIWEYDSENKLVAGTSFNGNGDIYFLYEMEYDNKGLLEKWLIYYPDGRLMHGDTDEYIYDENGIMIESKFMEGSIERKTTYKYDENNNIIEEKDFSNGELLSTYTYKYKNNNIIEEKSFEKEELISTHDYVYEEFDFNYNWTRRFENYWYKYQNRTGMRITIREIEYY
jgi:antitoxin component YwqK of YwqJK toxin-antitoxin module